MMKLIVVGILIILGLMFFIAVQLGAIQHGIDMGNNQKDDKLKEKDEKTTNKDDTGKKEKEKLP